MKKLINYFLELQPRGDKAYERKAKLQVIILIVSAMLVTIMIPLLAFESSPADLMILCILTCLSYIALYFLRKGVNYKAVTIPLIICLFLSNFSSHLMYYETPLIVIVWYIFYIQLSFYLLGEKWAFWLLMSCGAYSGFVAYLDHSGQIPEFFIQQNALGNVELTTTVSVAMMFTVSFIVQRYSVDSQSLTEEELKETIGELRIQQDNLEEVNKSISDSLDEKQRIYMVQYRLRKIESQRRKVLEAVNHKHPLEEVTQMVVNIISQFDEKKIGAIFWLEDDKFRKGPSIGIPEKYMNAIDGLDFAETVGACGPAIISKQPYFINDVHSHRNYEGFEDFVNDVGIVSSWSYPIFDTNEKVIGTFVLYGPESRKPNFDEKSFMEEMSSLVTMIITTSNAEKVAKEKEIAEKSLQFKSDFLAQMSHEIRTPLNGIIGMVDIMFNNTKLDDVQNSYVTTIKESSTDLMLIINDVLDISKLEAGKMQIINSAGSLNEALGKSVQLYKAKAEEKQIGLDLQFDESISKAHLLDVQRLRQVINNLISNAIKFTISGGVTVKAEFISNSAGIERGRISVKDSGTGISKKDQEKLFSKYTQLTANAIRNFDGAVKGTGLGLTISKQLIQLMGGKLQLISKLGKGSEFYFELDLEVTKSNTEKLSQKVRKAAKELNLKVLVAEDKIVNQKVAGLMLKSMKCEVGFANNGEECLMKVKEKPGYYDLILMDIQMPIMDGVTATQILKQDFKDVPTIIGLSANNMEGDAEKYMSLGLDDYIAKPIESDVLFEKLNSYFNK